jgi:hypothetical protein
MDRKRRLEGQAFADAGADRSSKPSSAMSSFYVSWPLAWVSLVTGRSSVRELVVLPDLVSHADDQVPNGRGRPGPGRVSGGEAVAAATGFLRH